MGKNEEAPNIVLFLLLAAVIIIVAGLVVKIPAIVNFVVAVSRLIP